jgi:CRP-like cAMP-binding protein
MLSTIEKVIILNTVDLFSATPEDVLSEVADLLVELRVPNDTQIFAKDDPGDSMYIIVVGEVRVHDGATTLNHLGERMIFGEMALLDAAPRVASVTTIDDTLLLRLDQEPFFELMDDRIEIARGIIRVLTGHLRNRVRDLTAELRNHKTFDATQTHSTVLKPSMR